MDKIHEFCSEIGCSIALTDNEDRVHLRFWNNDAQLTKAANEIANRPIKGFKKIILNVLLFIVNGTHEQAREKSMPRLKELVEANFEYTIKNMCFPLREHQAFQFQLGGKPMFHKEQAPSSKPKI